MLLWLEIDIPLRNQDLVRCSVCLYLLCNSSIMRTIYIRRGHMLSGRIGELLLILLIILVVFGAGKLPKVMGDLGRGIRSFKKGLDNDEQQNHEDDRK